MRKVCPAPSSLLSRVTALLPTLALAALPTGCGDNTAPAAGDPDAAITPTPDADVTSPPDADVVMPDAATSATVAVPLLRILPWVGGGLQLAVELPPEVAAPTDGGAVNAWIVSDGATTAAELRPAGVTTGVTAILLVPSADGLEHARRIDAALALIDALPEGERVALLIARATPEVAADMALDHRHARARIAALAPEASAGAAAVMPAAREAMSELESKFGPLGRTIIVVGDDVDEAPASALRPVQTVIMAVSDTPALDAAEALATVQARRDAIYWVGACAGLPLDQAFTLRLGDDAGAGEGQAIGAGPEPMDDQANLACDPLAAATDAFPYPDEVTFTFTPAERAAYQQNYDFQSEDTWTASVALGDGTPITASAHFRGQGTLGCVRKSINLSLDGARRRLMPGVADDRVLLVSMCQDTRYFGQVWGNRLLAHLGQYEMKARYVRLIIDGQNLGVYMMVERPEDAMRDGGLATATVVRRRYDIYDQPAEVKYPSDPVVAEAARLRFEDIGNQALNAPAGNLDATLDARIELDTYFLQLATMSLLENGDYIDESWFYAATEPTGEFYRSMAWDTDDLQSLCHGGGGAGIVDPCGLAYCAEAELDHAMLRSPAIYARYKAALAEVMDRLSPALMQSTMDDVRAELFAAIDSDQTAAALLEMLWENPAANTEATAEADIAGYMTAFLQRAEDRRAVLTAALSSCPE